MLNFASLNQARDIKAVKLFANTYLAKPFVVIADSIRDPLKQKCSFFVQEMADVPPL